MAAAVRVRGDYEAAQLRRLAKQSEDAAQTRRLLALAAIYDGGSRTEAARIGGVGLQTVRDWVLAFNAEGPSGLVNGKALGNAPLLSDVNRQALMQIVESGPIPTICINACRFTSLRSGALPSALPFTKPEGPSALNASTQSRTVCNPTPPIRAASVRDPPS